MATFPALHRLANSGWFPLRRRPRYTWIPAGCRPRFVIRLWQNGGVSHRHLFGTIIRLYRRQCWRRPQWFRTIILHR
jgi:hypothetical protein